MRISDWSSDVCSSDLAGGRSRSGPGRRRCPGRGRRRDRRPGPCGRRADRVGEAGGTRRSPDGRRRGGANGGVAADRQGGGDRTSAVSGKRVKVRVVIGGRRVIKKKTKYTIQ